MYDMNVFNIFILCKQRSNFACRLENSFNTTIFYVLISSRISISKRFILLHGETVVDYLHQRQSQSNCNCPARSVKKTDIVVLWRDFNVFYYKYLTNFERYMYVEQLEKNEKDNLNTKFQNPSFNFIVQTARLWFRWITENMHNMWFKKNRKMLYVVTDEFFIYMCWTKGS